MGPLSAVLMKRLNTVVVYLLVALLIFSPGRIALAAGSEELSMASSLSQGGNRVSEQKVREQSATEQRSAPPADRETFHPPDEVDTKSSSSPSLSAESAAVDSQPAPQPITSLPTPKTKYPAPETDLATGSLKYAITLSLPQGRNGLHPDVQLTYHSQSTDEGSFVGYGWELNIPSIERINKTGSNKLYSDNYLTSSLSGELVLVSGTTYRTKVETGSFLDYNCSPNGCTARDKRGVTYKFGSSAASRQDDPADPARVYKWMLDEIRDPNDNYVRYAYYKDSGQIYPARIVYTGHGATDGPFEVEFLQESRTEAYKSYKPAFAVTTNHRLSEIDVKINGSWVRRYILTYITGEHNKRTLLKSVTEEGRDDAGNILTMPATSFEYQTSPPGDAWVYGGNTIPAPLSQCILADVNGDGLTDILHGYEPLWQPPILKAYLNDGQGGWAESQNYKPPVKFFHYDGIADVDRGVRAIDVNGDGLSDLVEASSLATRTWLNTGNGWALTAGTWLPPLTFAHANGNLSQEYFAQLADVNGDGLIDLLRAYTNPWNPADIQSWVYLNNGIDGWTRDPNWVIPVDLRWGTYVIDINNDGLADILQSYRDSNSNKQRAFLNNGRNEWVLQPSFIPPILFYDLNVDPRDQGVRLFDVNGDGLPDILKNQGGRGAPPTANYLNTGFGWVQGSGDWDSWESFSVNNNSRDIGVRPIDIDGDGMVDVIRADNDGSSRSVKNVKANPDLLVKITYPQGGSFTIGYEATPRYSSGSMLLNPALPIVLDTVNQITSDDGFGTTGISTYSYENGRFYFGSATDRRFAGFAKVTATSPNNSVTESYFHQGNASDEPGGEYQDHPSKIGFSYLEQVTDKQGKLFTRRYSKWDKAGLGNGRSFVFLAGTVEQDFAGTLTPKAKATDYRYDTNTGNLLVRTDYGEAVRQDDGSLADLGADKYVTTYQYATSVGATLSPLLDAVSAEVVTDQSGAKVSETKHYYDNLGLGSVTNGNQTKLERWIKASSYSTTQKEYNEYGLVKAEIDARGHRIEYEYDLYHLYPITVLNRGLTSNGQVALDIHYEYDYASGQVKKITDPNGLSQQFTFDSFNRLLKVEQPSLTNASVMEIKTAFDYVDTPNAVRIKQIEYLDADNYAEAYTYLDGFGRVIQTRKEAMNGNFAVADTIYNSLGQVQKSSLPYFSSGSAKTPPTTNQSLYTVFTYDSLSRVTQTQNAVGKITNTYTPWAVKTTDADGKVKELRRDAYERLVQVNEHNNGSIYATRYEYNGQGKLTKVIDAEGNVRNFEYDGLGRRVKAEDLHQSNDSTFGVWSYTYDDSNNLIRRTDPNGRILLYSCDDFDRLNKEVEQGKPGNALTYTHDNCPLGKGRLCQTSNSALITSLAYDVLGKVSQETKVIQGQTFSQEYKYDRQSNLTHLTLPDGSQIQYAYNSAGQLNQINQKQAGTGGITALITKLEYAPAGQAQVIEYANGAKTENLFDPNELWRLKRKTTFIPGSLITLPAPAFSAQGLVNSASYTNRITPGQILSLFGTSLIGNALNCGPASSFPLPTTLCGTTVTFTGSNGVSKDAPLLYVSPAQVNLQVPYEMPVGTTTVKIRANERESQSVTAQISDLAPGVFTQNASGTGDATAINTNNQNSLVSKSNPAKPGHVLSVFATGLGVGTPPAETGKAALASPLSTVVKPALILTRNGKIWKLDVQFAGKAPGYAGLDQINVQLPDSGLEPALAEYELRLCYPESATNCAASQNASNLTKLWIAPNGSAPLVDTVQEKVGPSADPSSKTKKQVSTLLAATVIAQDLSYTYSPAGDILKITEAASTSAKRDVVYQYDDLHRLISAEGKDGVGKPLYTENYEYSPVGNLLSKKSVANGRTLTYIFKYEGYWGTSYANPHAVTSLISNWSTKNFSYDRNGNLAAEVVDNVTTISYQWDAWNRLSAFSSPWQTINYAYDSNGQRALIKGATGTTLYPSQYYNLEAKGSGSSSTTTLTKHIFAGSQLIATIQKSGTLPDKAYYQHTDHLSGSNIISNEQGSIEEITDYYPYGQIRVDERISAFSEQRKFTGHQYDADTGLLYMNTRYQNPTIGRFVSQDSLFIAIGDNGQVVQITGSKLQKILTDPQSLNSYAYARNNPLRMVDPSGEWFWDLVTGKQSWNSFVVEVGDAANYLYDNSGTWKTAMDHPYATGAVVGIGGGLAAYGVAYGVTYLSTTYLGGVGTGCLMACGTMVQKAPEYASRGYASFQAFKNAVGSADPTGQNLRQWHHIVEQNTSNVTKFGQQIIQNGNNIVNIPTKYHQQVTAFYNSAMANGTRVRDYVNTLDYQTQFQIGAKVLDNVVNSRAPGTGLGF